MSQALYEEYKEALRRGHVAALRGRLDGAGAACRAAAASAPDRALPYVSLGAVLRRAERIDDALASFGVALSLAPEDEGALRGRAELQAERGRRAEAALDFETLAGVLERGGRLSGAADAAPRAPGTAAGEASLVGPGGGGGAEGAPAEPAVDVAGAAPPPAAPGASSAADAGSAPTAEPGPGDVARQEAEPGGPAPPPEPAVPPAGAGPLLP